MYRVLFLFLANFHSPSHAEECLRNGDVHPLVLRDPPPRLWGKIASYLSAEDTLKLALNHKKLKQSLEFWDVVRPVKNRELMHYLQKNKEEIKENIQHAINNIPLLALLYTGLKLKHADDTFLFLQAVSGNMDGLIGKRYALSHPLQMAINFAAAKSSIGFEKYSLEKRKNYLARRMNFDNKDSNPFILKIPYRLLGMTEWDKEMDLIEDVSRKDRGQRETDNPWFEAFYQFVTGKTP